jgi:hypothetical protein
VQAMRAEAAACSSTAPDHLRSRYSQLIDVLDGEKDEFRRRIDNRNWMEGERNRLAAMPATLASLKATQNFELSPDDARQRQIGPRERARFFEAGVAPVRQAALTAAIVEVAALFERAQPAEPSEQAAYEACNMQWAPPESLRKACEKAGEDYLIRVVKVLTDETIAAIKAAPRTLAGLQGTDGYKRNTSKLDRMFRLASQQLQATEAEFERIVAPLRAEAVAAAKAEIDAAFAAARPNQPAERAANKLCDSISTQVQDIREHCKTALAAYDERRNTLLCDAALEAHKAKPAMLDVRFGFTSKTNIARIVTGREFVCSFARVGQSVEFKDTSGLFSSGLEIKIATIQVPGSPVAADAHYLLKMTPAADAGGKYWKPAAIQTVGGSPTGAELAVAEQMLACMLGAC